MFRKNTASQFIHFQGVDATTGGIKSGVTWTARRCIDGTFAAATGTATEDGTTGWYKFALSQADTNGNNIGFNFTGTGAVPQTVNIVTTAADPTDGVRLGLTALPNAAAEAAGGLYTRGTGAGQIAQDANGNVRVNLDTIKTQAVTCAGGVTVPAATLASTTNITAGTITTVTNLTNAPTAGDLTATMKTSVTTAATAATPTVTAGTVSDKTGYALSAGGVQAIWDALSSALTTVGSIGKRLVDYLTGDSYARLGAPAGASHAADVAAVKTDTAAIKLKTDNLPATPAATGDAMTLASAYDFAKGTVAMTESYAADGAAMTPVQALHMLWSFAAEKNVSSTTVTTKKLDGTTTSMTFTLDSASAPTSITRSG